MIICVFHFHYMIYVYICSFFFGDTAFWREYADIYILESSNCMSSTFDIITSFENFQNFDLYILEYPSFNHVCYINKYMTQLWTFYMFLGLFWIFQYTAIFPPKWGHPIYIAPTPLNTLYRNFHRNNLHFDGTHILNIWDFHNPKSTLYFSWCIVFTHWCVHPKLLPANSRTNINHCIWHWYSHALKSSILMQNLKAFSSPLIVVSIEASCKIMKIMTP